jgi:hypothetical protein
LTLLWVAVDGGQGERAVLPAAGAPPDTTQEMADLLESIRTSNTAIADQRGLPITLPLLDLEDMNQIEFADVWGGFEQSLLPASTRYGADAVLVGRIRVTQFGQEVEWLLLRDGQRRLTAGTDVAEGLRAGLTPAVAHMPLEIVVGALLALTSFFWLFGLRSFHRRAIG